MRKPPIWNLQPGLVAPAWRAHWRGAKAVFPLFEATGASVHAVPLSTRWQLANGAVRRVTCHGPSGGWLWMLSSGRLWGRHDGINSPNSASGPLITAGWHSFVRVWEGREVRQYVDGMRFTTTPVTATGPGTLHRLGWQIFAYEAFVQAELPFFAAFSTA
jgi:hypothetical protein